MLGREGEFKTVWQRQDDDPRAPFDKAFAMSGDKDFLPAAEMVIRDAGKDVTVVR